MTKRLLPLLVIGAMFSCQQPASRQSADGSDSVAAGQPAQPGAVSATAGSFDVSRIPVSTASVGAFPYFSLPDGYVFATHNPLKDYDHFPFWVGGHYQWEEGKVFYNNIHAKNGKNFSALELKKNLENLITSVGGVKVFEGKIPSDTTSALNDRPDDITVGYVDGMGDIYNDPVSVYVIRRSDRIIWVHLCVSSQSAGMVILETQPFDQTASLIPAERLSQEIADSGKAVIHINFATDRADILTESFPQVSAIVQLLQRDTLLKLSVNGYTDNTGESMHNLVLSQQRAAEVVKALEDSGIGNRRLKARGFGEQRPRGDNDTESGRAENRRVELVRL